MESSGCKSRTAKASMQAVSECCHSPGDWWVRSVHSKETGSTNDRAEFQAMFRDASQRNLNVLLFWALDRLSREGVLETLQYLNRLTACGVGYQSFTEQFFDSCGVFKDTPRLHLQLASAE